MPLSNVLPIKQDRLTKVYLSKPAGEMVEACFPSPKLVITAWSIPVAIVKTCGECKLAPVAAATHFLAWEAVPERVV